MHDLDMLHDCVAPFCVECQNREGRALVLLHGSGATWLRPELLASCGWTRAGASCGWTRTGGWQRVEPRRPVAAGSTGATTAPKKERVEFKKAVGKYLPKGSVGNQIKAKLPPECSSCDERTKRNRPPAAEFAAKRIQTRRSRRLQLIHQMANTAKPFPKLPEQGEDEEETPDDPVNDRDPDGGDGSEPDWSGDESGANAPIVAAAAC